MYERFTDRARKVMQLANQEAQRFNHEYIGTEHILLGIVKEGSGVGANALKNLDIDLRKIRLEVEKIVQSSLEVTTMGTLPQTPRAKKVIEYAIEESRILNHNYVGTEHLLLGLIREEEGVASQVLRNLGLKLEDLREELLNLLGNNQPPEESCRIASGERSSSQTTQPTPVLNKLGCDLTLLARQGKFDLPVGWATEIEAAFLVLSCRTKTSLLIVGEPGVGKTRFVESLALLALEGPQPMQQHRFVAVHPSPLCLTPHKSTLWMLNEVRRSGNVVLVLDDLSLFVDPDSCPGGRVVGNLLRTALAWGDISCVATTTPACYEALLRTDEVFRSRFQPIRLPAPSPEATIAILQKVRDRYESHHRTAIKDDSLVAAVRLSAGRRDRAYPAKAVELLDQACARARLRAVTQPPDSREIDAQVEQLDHEKDLAVAEQDFEKAAHLRDQADKLKKRKVQILHAWKEKMRESDAIVDAEAVAAVVEALWQDGR
jgi:ATP-dependent Clp protease ATP-binding subunit ClpC